MNRVGQIHTASAIARTAIPRVGLVNGLTGIPLVVLFLEDVVNSHEELRSLEKAEMLREKAGSTHDRQAWELVEAFFHSGGSRAHVLCLPLPATRNRLKAMIGRDGGIARRSGIQTVRDWAEKADLLCIPQASRLLSTDSYQAFVQAVLELLGPAQGMLLLVDLPCVLDAEEAVRFVQPLFSPDAAVFHPWLMLGEKAVAPSVAMAAWLQRSDSEVGVGELGTDSPLEAVSPFRAPSCAERRALHEGRINTYLSHAGSIRLWGAFTLADQADWRARLIPLRRSSLKIQQAVEQICEPFVLEAADDELPVWIENSLQSFLRSVRTIFHRDMQEPFTTSVQVISREDEERIQVQLQYALPHSLEKFSFSFVA